MTPETIAFCKLLDEYFKELTAPAYSDPRTISARQTSIDQARVALVRSFEQQQDDAARWRWCREHQLPSFVPWDLIADHGIAKLAHVSEQAPPIRVTPAIPPVLAPATIPTLPVVMPPQCGCNYSDPWRCAGNKNLSMLICHCGCHRQSAGVQVKR